MRKSKYLLQALLCLAFLTAIFCLFVPFGVYAYAETVTAAEGVSEDEPNNEYTYYLDWTNLSFMYDGNSHVPSAVLKCEEDESIENSVSVSIYKNGELVAEAKNAGSYDAVADCGEFTVLENTESFTISPKSVAVNWSKAETYTYNGNVQCPTASYVDVNGNKISLSANGAEADAGSYTASVEASAAGGNYTLTNLFCDYVISPKSVAVDWSKAETYTYNGNAQCPTASYVDVNGNKISLSANGAETDAGSYTASVKDNAAGGNYTLTNLTCDYTIGKFVGKVIWAIADFYIANGQVQRPKAYFVDAQGNVIELTVQCSGFKAGEYSASIDASDVGSNYALTGDLICSYTILPETSFGIGGVTLSVIFGVLLLVAAGGVTYLIFLRKKELYKVKSEKDDTDNETKRQITSLKNQVSQLSLDIEVLSSRNERIKRERDDLVKDFTDCQKQLVTVTQEWETLQSQAKLAGIDKGKITELEQQVEALREENKKLKEFKGEKASERHGVQYYKHPIEDYFPEIDEALNYAEGCSYDASRPEESYVSQRQQLNVIKKCLTAYRTQRR